MKGNPGALLARLPVCKSSSTCVEVDRMSVANRTSGPGVVVVRTSGLSVVVVRIRVLGVVVNRTSGLGVVDRSSGGI